VSSLAGRLLGSKTGVDTPIKSTTATPLNGDKIADSESESTVPTFVDEEGKASENDNNKSKRANNNNSNALISRTSTASTEHSVVMSKANVLDATPKKNTPQSQSSKLKSPYVGAIMKIISTKKTITDDSTKSLFMEFIEISTQALFSKSIEGATCKNELLNAIAAAIYYRQRGDKEEVL
jgi:hypothetical protein